MKLLRFSIIVVALTLLGGLAASLSGWLLGNTSPKALLDTLHTLLYVHSLDDHVVPDRDYAAYGAALGASLGLTVGLMIGLGIALIDQLILAALQIWGKPKTASPN